MSIQPFEGTKRFSVNVEGQLQKMTLCYDHMRTRLRRQDVLPVLRDNATGPCIDCTNENAVAWTVRRLDVHSQADWALVEHFLAPIVPQWAEKHLYGLFRGDRLLGLVAGESMGMHISLLLNSVE